MEIIIDATTTQDMAYSGTGQYTHNLISALVSGFPKTQYRLFMYDTLSSTLEDSTLLKKNNVVVERVGECLPSFANTFTYLTRIAPKLNLILSQGKKVVYFAPYFQRGFPTLPIPSVVSVFDFAMPKFNYFSNKGRIMNFLRKREFWYRMHQTTKASAVIMISESTRRDYMDSFPRFPQKKSIITPLGVDLEIRNSKDFEKYLPSDWKRKGYFIYLGGGLQKNKNSEGVVEAYATFVKLASKASKSEKVPYLVIAGKIFEEMKSEQSRKLRALIKKHKIHDKVIFTGFYSDKDKYPLLKNSIAFIHLSLCEGFGLAVVEAMRAKTPVIVHDGSSYPEVVGDSGILVDGLKPEAVANQMYKIFLDKKLRNDLASKVYQRSLRFTWDTTARLTHGVLKKVYNGTYLVK